MPLGKVNTKVGLALELVIHECKLLKHRQKVHSEPSQTSNVEHFANTADTCFHEHGF